MRGTIALRNLEGLDANKRNAILGGLIDRLPLASPESVKATLRTRLQAYEVKYGMKSEVMIEQVDCKTRKDNPELHEWAMLYRCYLDIE